MENKKRGKRVRVNAFRPALNVHNVGMWFPETGYVFVTSQIVFFKNKNLKNN